MSRSIRRTLTWWYVGSLAVILCLFSGLLYSTLAAGLTRDVDRSLILQARGVAETIDTFWKAEGAAKEAVPGNWDTAPSANLHDEASKGRLADLIRRWAQVTETMHDERALSVLDEHGDLLAMSDNFASLKLPIRRITLMQAMQGRPVYETFRLPQGRIRLVTRPVLDHGHVVYFVQVAGWLKQIDASLNQLRLWLLWLIPLTLVGTSSIGWFLATTALRPVDEMIAQARRISAERLDDRIDVSRTGQELQLLATTFNDMLARLESDFHRLRQFSAAASHELRTPLTVLKGELEVTLRHPRDAQEYDRVLRTNLETINEMAYTVEGLLLLARTEASAGGVEWQPVELGALAQQISETSRRMAEGKRVALDILVNEPVWVRGERRLLERVIANLLDNALRHTPPEGRITLRTERRGNDACLIVQDTGPGIPPEELPQIFTKFFRPKSPTDGTRSSGLGLGLCRWIVEAHHGRIEVASEPERGSVFTVCLPAISIPRAVQLAAVAA